ncbi:hypothetical protein NKH18_33545 [Streptomyces sp. M10(2022)]
MLLGTAGAVMIAWEIRQFVIFPAQAYPDWFIGGDVVPVELTGAPPGGTAWHSRCCAWWWRPPRSPAPSTSGRWA